jgi:hypothetical protein
MPLILSTPHTPAAEQATPSPSVLLVLALEYTFLPFFLPWFLPSLSAIRFWLYGKREKMAWLKEKIASRVDSAVLNLKFLCPQL